MANMNKQSFVDGLLSFLDASPTPFHAVANMSSTLSDAGFTELDERDLWDINAGRYFVCRNGSSIVAFIVGKQPITETGVRMVGAHTDSPCLRVKPNPDLTTAGYLHLSVEVYGGVLLNPWFDRDLSLAGRVTIKTAEGIVNELVDFKSPIAAIPSLAIHLNRGVNDGQKINPQTDIPPILMRAKKGITFDDLLTAELNKGRRRKISLLGHELSFYDTHAPALTGMEGEFIASARLDNLLSCYTGLVSLLDASDEFTSVLVCNDHEEVGSASAEGAEGPFLGSVLSRILPDPESYYRTIANSFMISTDNAHGIHPNYVAKHDRNHGPLINDGPVIKINANQRYATNSETAGYFRELCRRAKVRCQAFTVRSDMACGSTIGPITAKEIGVRTLDVGVPTFAMHSIRELAGRDDAHALYKALLQFYKDKGTPGAL